MTPFFYKIAASILVPDIRIGSHRIAVLVIHERVWALRYVVWKVKGARGSSEWCHWCEWDVTRGGEEETMLVCFYDQKALCVMGVAVQLKNYHNAIRKWSGSYGTRGG